MTARARLEDTLRRVKARFDADVKTLTTAAFLDTAGPIDWQRTLQEGMLRGLERVDERPCMIAGSFPWLPSTPAPTGLPAPSLAAEYPRDRRGRRAKTSPPAPDAPRAPRAPRPRRNESPVDLILTYRAPWTRDDVRHANVWSLDEDAGGIVVLAVARVTDVSRLIPVAIPVSRARRAGRRMLYAVGAGEDFCVEPTLLDDFIIEQTELDGLPRARFVLRGAPVDVAQKFRSMP